MVLLLSWAALHIIQQSVFDMYKRHPIASVAVGCKANEHEGERLLNNALQ